MNYKTKLRRQTLGREGRVWGIEKVSRAPPSPSLHPSLFQRSTGVVRYAVHRLDFRFRVEKRKVARHSCRLLKLPSRNRAIRQSPGATVPRPASKSLFPTKKFTANDQETPRPTAARVPAKFNTRDRVMRTFPGGNGGHYKETFGREMFNLIIIYNRGV